MKTGQCLLLCFLILAIAPAQPAFAQNGAPPAQLVQASLAQTDLAKLGPVKIQAAVFVNPGTRQEVGGVLSFEKNGDNFREELGFNGYRETTVGAAGRIYLVRNPSVVFPLFSIIRNLGALWAGSAAGQDSQAAEEENVDGMPAVCLSRKKEKECYDLSTKLPLERELSVSGMESPAKVVFRDWQTFEGQHLPRTISILQKDKEVASIRQITISKADISVGDFAAPPNAIEFCSSAIVEAKLRARVDPHYPEEARARHAEGIVRMVFIISKTGSVQDVTVIGGSPLLAPAAVEAIKQWKYSPATCGGLPVATETQAVVTFTIG